MPTLDHSAALPSAALTAEPVAAPASPRLVARFGRRDSAGQLWLHTLTDGADGYQERIEGLQSPMPSMAGEHPSAVWYEREIQDQFGIEVSGLPDARPLLFHENWPEGIHPLRDGWSALARPAESAGPAPALPRLRPEYPFLRVEGNGVCEVGVGPIHAGIIEPGHFRFSVMGDSVLHLELRHFYTHRGAETLFERLSPQQAILMAESISGDHCFSHALACCEAMESLAGIEAPPRAQLIRLLGLELERLWFHVGDVGALAGDVGYGAAASWCSRVREALLRASMAAVGTRFWRGINCPGGIRQDIEDEALRGLGAEVQRMHQEFAEMARILLETPSVETRFDDCGVLPAAVARDLAVVGPVARASGVQGDVRHDHPSGAYQQINPDVPVFASGDVMARVRVRIAEAAESATLIRRALAALRAGPVQAPLPEGLEGSRLAAVESPRGELIYRIWMEQGRVTRCYLRDPSFQNWPALPHAVIGGVIADFPLINKSFNLSYAGCDR